MTLPRATNGASLLLLASVLGTLSVRASDLSVASLIEQGHYKQAQSILSGRLRADPQDARSYAEMSKVSEAFDHWDEAIQQAEKAVSLERRNPDFQAALADAIGSKLSGAQQLGMFEKLSLARRFKKEAELALQLDPNNIDANVDLMEFHLDAPGLLGGSKDRAAELADRMVRTNPVRGYLMKFELAVHEKRNGELEWLLQQAIAADPKSYQARWQAANFYLGQGTVGLPRAEQEAREAIRIAPGWIRSYSTLATIYARQGRWKELDGLLADATRKIPDDLTPLYQAANSILLEGPPQELPRAERYIRAYMDQPPEGTEPTLAGAHWQLALILEKQGKTETARQELKQALSLDPTFQPAKKDLKRLR